MKAALEDRIDVLKFTEESLTSDFQNEMMTPRQYIMKVIEYVEYEKDNLEKAKAQGLNADDLALIKERITMATNEAKELKSEMKSNAAAA